MLKNKTAVAIVFIIGMLVMFYPFKFSKQAQYESWLEYTKNETYSGVVSKKFIDSNNHNDPTILFSNGTNCIIHLEFYSKINVGDSILKEKGSTKIFVYTTNNLVIFDNDSLYKKYTKN